MPEPQDGATSAELPARVGRYEVVGVLGRGSMGRVLLARDPVLDRNVAIKFLRQDLKLTPEERETLLRRMRQEARASARVTHPNIVALFDMGEEDDIGVFLVFEHAEGVTLKSRLTRGPLAPKAAGRLASELGDALATAHQAGVLHRDVKPENIILTKTGAKIADFGIARVPESTLTKGGGLLGTPAYSSPESVTYGEHSAASDQFSLAATLYEAVSGRRAFPGDDAVGVASRIQTEEPLPIARSLGLDAKVDAVLSRGMCKNAEKRFSSCAELGHAFSKALDAREPELRSAQVTVPDAHHRALASGQISASRRVRIALGGLLVGVLLTLLVMRLATELRTTEPLPAASVEPATTTEAATEPAAEESPRATSPQSARPSRTDSVPRGSTPTAAPGSPTPRAKKSPSPQPTSDEKPASPAAEQGSP